MTHDDKSGARGFTLIEILVALMVFLTGVTGLLALMTSALAMHRDGITLARATGDLDGIVAKVRREVALGRHHDQVNDTWIDVEAASMPDGTVYSVRFVPAARNGLLLAELRLAGNERNLARAPVIRIVLPTDPLRAEAVMGYRSRRKR
ncbi:MAG: type IV pilus modification PilV family protein [Planctomycetota bacterium]|jgi:prepilin-type N-terminal cleavage/methylation domain-containing protein